MKSPLNRREFLRNAGLAAGAVTLGQLNLPRAFANAAQPGPILVHLTAYGGAHSPLGLNPLILNDLYKRKIDPVPQRDSEFLAAYKDDQIIKTSHHLLGEAGAPLVENSADISIINGMMMLADSPIHETNNAFMSTGDEDGREELFIQQMRRQFDPSIFGFAQQTIFSSLAGGVPLSDLGVNSMVDKAALFVKHGTKTSGSSNLAMLQRNLVEIQKRLDRTQKVRSTLGALADLPDPNGWQVNLLSALGGGIVNYAFVELSGTENVNLDTHFNHDLSQKQSQRAVFTQISNLIKRAKAIPDGKGSLYDRMVILYTTEFARTSWAESRDGTGHNPHNNSALIAGGLIRGGVNLGQSTVIPSSRIRGLGIDGRSRLQALPFDFSKYSALSYEDGLKFIADLPNRRKQDGQHTVDYIYPGNLMKTAAIAMGLQPTGKLPKYNTLEPLLKRA